MRTSRRRTSRKPAARGRRRVLRRNTDPATYSDRKTPVDQDFAEREAEAQLLLRSDITSMLDTSEEWIADGQALVARSATTYDLHEASLQLVRASMLAELAYGLNCDGEVRNGEQCYRSGELIYRAQSVMDDLIHAAVRLGIRQKTEAIQEAPPRKKKGWLSW